MTEEPNTLDIEEASSKLHSVVAIAGKSNSIKNGCRSTSPFSDSFSSITLWAVKMPESVENSTVFSFTKPDVKQKCAAAKVA